MSSRVVFRASAVAYESARRQIDEALNFPRDGIATAFDPAESAPVDAEGRRYVSLTLFEAAACPTGLLSSLLASGNVEQVTQEDYDAAVLASRRAP